MKRTHLHPVSIEVRAFMAAVGGKVEISTTVLWELLQRQSTESSRNDERWPDCLHSVAMALSKNTPELRSLGISVKRQNRGRKENGKKNLVWVLDPQPTGGTQ